MRGFHQEKRVPKARRYLPGKPHWIWGKLGNQGEHFHISFHMIHYACCVGCETNMGVNRLGVVNSCVHPSFHPTDVGWNLRSIRKFPTPCPPNMLHCCLITWHKIFIIPCRQPRFEVNLCIIYWWHPNDGQLHFDRELRLIFNRYLVNRIQQGLIRWLL